MSLKVLRYQCNNFIIAVNNNGLKLISLQYFTVFIICKLVMNGLE